MTDRNTIYVFTDGSCLGNQNKHKASPGGWAYGILYYDEYESQSKQFLDSGGDSDTTNNKMELSACIEALSYITKHLDTNKNVVLYTDSQYTINGITSWIKGWMKNNWKKSDGKEVLNSDLWAELYSFSKDLNIEWNFVKAHTGKNDPISAWNNVVDIEARAVAETFSRRRNG